MVTIMEEKSLSFNAAKCHYSTVTESSIPYVINSPPKIRQLPITPTDNQDYLGVTIDPKLTWQVNTDRKVAKAKKAIGTLRRLVKNKLPAVHVRKLLNSKVTPVFLYGITATYPRCRRGQLSLERLNRFVARLSTNRYDATYQQLLSSTHMKPVFQTVLHRRIQLMQKYYTGKRYIPPGSIRPFVQNPILRQRFQDFALSVIEPTGMRYRHSSLEMAIQVWNRLPDDIVRGNTGGIKTRLENASYFDLLWMDCSALSQAILTL